MTYVFERMIPNGDIWVVRTTQQNVSDACILTSDQVETLITKNFTLEHAERIKITCTPKTQVIDLKKL